MRRPRCRAAEPNGVPITLVESEEIGTVGVGEATIPHIINFNRMLGLKKHEFMKATLRHLQARHRVRELGRRGLPLYSSVRLHGDDLQGHGLFHQLLAARARRRRPTSHPATMRCARLRRAAQVPPAASTNRVRLSDIAYAYHFDATLYARYLRARPRRAASGGTKADREGQQRAGDRLRRAR